METIQEKALEIQIVKNNQTIWQPFKTRIKNSKYKHIGLSVDGINKYVKEKYGENCWVFLCCDINDYEKEIPLKSQIAIKEAFEFGFTDIRIYPIKESPVVNDPIVVAEYKYQSYLITEW